MKILVVEDDRKVAGFIEQGLKEEGYVVDVAPDGDEATMLAHVYEYDVILLDVVLPRKNGFQVATELRREGRNTPILMLTSRDAVEDVVRGLDAGADDYLAKPFLFDELLARIRALHRRGGAERLDVLRYGPIALDRLQASGDDQRAASRSHPQGVPASRILPAAPGGGRPAHGASGKSMGHALRSGEQRRGRARGKSAAKTHRGRGRAAPGHDSRRGLQPPARRRLRRAPGGALTRWRAGLLPGGAALFILAGLALKLGGRAEPAALVWSSGLVLTGLPVVWGTLRGVAAGRFAADLVAMLAIVTALLLGQPLAGLIVVLMQTGGEALERYAEGRASEAVRELEAAAPRLAHRVSGDDVEDVSAEAIAIGDTLLLRPGELIPSDAVVLEGRSHVDASRLTGEPIPVSARPGTTLLSGSLNLEGALTVRATAPARQSQYAKIVELVRTAQASKSPLQRLADRYAVWFTPATLLVCLARICDVRRSASSAGSAGGGHSVSAHPGHAGGGGGRDQSRGPSRNHLPPWRGTRAARRCHRRRVRQDGNADRGTSRGGPGPREPAMDA